MNNNITSDNSHEIKDIPLNEDEQLLQWAVENLVILEILQNVNLS